MEAKRKRHILVIAAAVIAVAMALVVAWRYTPLREVLTVSNIVGMIEAISGKWWAPIVVVLAYTPASLVMFPRPIITIAAVVVFGPFEGFALAMAGVVVAAVVIYLLGRRIPEKFLRRLAGRRSERLCNMLQRKGFMAIATIGLLPVAPFPVEMAMAGALRIRIRDLVLGVAVANTPGMLGMTVLSHQIMALLDEGRRMNPAVIAAVVVALAALGFVTHRMWRRMEAEMQAS